jgi:hypothetical protein
MASMPKWIKGFSRIFVVLFALLWLSISLIVVHDSSSFIRALIKPHLSPYADENANVFGALAETILPDFHPASSFAPPVSDRWYHIVASADFLNESERERALIAEKYFAEKLAPIADATYIDTEKFRTEFVQDATATLEEKPINKYSDGRSYREIDAWPGPIRITAIFLDAEILTFSAFTAALCASLLLLVYMIGRWILAGFRW